LEAEQLQRQKNTRRRQRTKVPQHVDTPATTEKQIICCDANHTPSNGSIYARWYVQEANDFLQLTSTFSIEMPNFKCCSQILRCLQALPRCIAAVTNQLLHTCWTTSKAASVLKKLSLSTESQTSLCSVMIPEMGFT
jgi:hypothetical protein